MLTILRAAGAVMRGLSVVFVLIAYPFVVACAVSAMGRDWCIARHNRIAAGRRALQEEQPR